jgi:uncharacterized protein Yka (UPF0111/DUF47 family)
VFALPNAKALLSAEDLFVFAALYGETVADGFVDAVELVDFLEWVQAEIGDGFVEFVDLLLDAAEELAHVLNFIRIFGMFDRACIIIM